MAGKQRQANLSFVSSFSLCNHQGSCSPTVQFLDLAPDDVARCHERLHVGMRMSAAGVGNRDTNRDARHAVLRYHVPIVVLGEVSWPTSPCCSGLFPSDAFAMCPCPGLFKVTVGTCE